jgi:DNA-binding CsgD family transcriptional regulator
MIKTRIPDESMKLTSRRSSTTASNPLLSRSRSRLSTSPAVTSSISPSTRTFNPLAIRSLVDTSATRALAVRQLRRSDRERLVLRLRDDLTQYQIAEQTGGSQMQVSRILRRITDQLHEHIEGRSRLCRPASALSGV